MDDRAGIVANGARELRDYIGIYRATAELQRDVCKHDGSSPNGVFNQVEKDFAQGVRLFAGSPAVGAWNNRTSGHRKAHTL